LTKIPIIPIEIFLGSLLISYDIIEKNYIFDLVAHLGFLYLMFLTGLEINLKELFKVSNSIIKRGIIYTVLLYLISLMLYLYFDLAKIFIVILPLISIGLLASLKKDYKDAKWIDLAITVGLIGEIVSIVVLTAVSAGLEYGLGFMFYKTLIELLIVFGVMIALYKLFRILIWWFPQIKTSLMPRSDTQYKDVRLAIGIFFFLTAIMIYMHLEVVLGAFIAGIFIATFFEHNTDLPHKMTYLGFGWLVPTFFIWIGTSFNLNAIFLDDLAYTAFIIVVAMIAMRVVASALFIKFLGIRDTILFALSHSMPLTLLIAVATLALQNNSITLYYYYAFILAAIFEVIVSIILIKIISYYQKSKI
jgi:Kef-type K+ transport system membrane component KefB